jgi:hypothetical protein
MLTNQSLIDRLHPFKHHQRDAFVQKHPLFLAQLVHDSVATRKVLSAKFVLGKALSQPIPASRHPTLRPTAFRVVFNPSPVNISKCPKHFSWKLCRVCKIADKLLVRVPTTRSELFRENAGTEKHGNLGVYLGRRMVNYGLVHFPLSQESGPYGIAPQNCTPFFRDFTTESRPLPSKPQPYIE